jgi:hypothetical protein
MRAQGSDPMRDVDVVGDQHPILTWPCLSSCRSSALKSCLLCVSAGSDSHPRYCKTKLLIGVDCSIANGMGLKQVIQLSVGFRAYNRDPDTLGWDKVCPIGFFLSAPGSDDYRVGQSYYMQWIWLNCYVYCSHGANASLVRLRCHLTMWFSKCLTPCVNANLRKTSTNLLFSFIPSLLNICNPFFLGKGVRSVCFPILDD